MAGFFPQTALIYIVLLSISICVCIMYACIYLYKVFDTNTNPIPFNSYLRSYSKGVIKCAKHLDVHACSTENSHHLRWLKTPGSTSKHYCIPQQDPK